ncbi:MAG: hypothetical protein QOE70_4915 [Chthoniobacter sp.]|jgi:hypothetical protein|nr:hypothetical protein [Chthoniobacter sp.]
MAGYVHHVFVSYRRGGEWEAWVRRFFAPKLRTFLGLHLPGGVSVYLDEQIDTGAAWQTALDQAIDSTRIMVPVFMCSFFDSQFCRNELARMFHREHHLGFRSDTNAAGLVVPVRLSETEYFPDFVNTIQQEDLTHFAIPNLAPATPTHESFDLAMKTFALKVATAIRRVPSYDPEWARLDGTPYRARLMPKSLEQEAPPRWAA